MEGHFSFPGELLVYLLKKNIKRIDKASEYLSRPQHEVCLQKKHFTQNYRHDDVLMTMHYRHFRLKSIELFLYAEEAPFTAERSNACFLFCACEHTGKSMMRTGNVIINAVIKPQSLEHSRTANARVSKLKDIFFQYIQNLKDISKQQPIAHSVTFPNRLWDPEGEKCSRYHQNNAENGFLFRFEPFSCHHGESGPPRHIKLRPCTRDERIDHQFMRPTMYFECEFHFSSAVPNASYL